MQEYFKGWKRKAMRKRVLKTISKQRGISLEKLRVHPACKNLDNMDSLELVELVATLTDESP